ncbi:peptide ABC transporter substrate-binding protein [Embleya scabrispora]|uniref:Peptide ABC transporter substrate-binding protein n=1 Tax=Embleya scabrispora TaxID=159449 RepID=A0A1T3NIL9_9ACTN|nr:ABC transporter substrate-binding protein [Embleya scabrispora]OPC76565.1 peptide ABC transporter substrate-binding protein [Embleya scabrispora]
MPGNAPFPSRPSIRRAAVPAAVLALALVAACSGPPKNNDNPAGPSGGGTNAGGFALSAGTPPAKGDIDKFGWALYAEPLTLDWIQAFDYPQNTVLSNVCESLMRWTPDLKVQPGLAQKASNPDPNTWVYDLRQGVKFHNGETMTADDVVFSFGRQMNPDLAASWAESFENVDAVTATGPLQVTVKLKKPDSLFPQLMATAAGVVANRRGVEAHGKDYGVEGSLECTGPYRLARWAKGQSVDLERFNGYWGTKPKAKTVEFKFLTDPSARTNAMLSGEVDGGFLIPTESYQRLRAGGVGTLYAGEGLSTVNVNVTSMKGALGDVRVRRALSMALDRSGFVKTALAGNGTVTNSITPKASWTGSSPQVPADAFDKLPPSAQDIDGAKKLIEEAGAKGKKVVVATSPIGQDVSLLATAIQDAGTRIGLDVELETIAPDAFSALFTDPAAREGIDMFPETYYLSVTDPVDLLRNFRTGGYQNHAGYSNPEYDALVEQITATYDPQQRIALEAKLQKMAADQVLWMPVAEWPSTVFLNKRITGAPTTIAYMYYPWAADVGAAG